MNAIERSKQYATEAHKNQKRATGEDYITHPEAVANSVIGKLRKVVAWLHDVIEDTDVTLDDVTKHFEGYECQEMMRVALDGLTYRKNEESYLDYILRVKEAGMVAIDVKIADIKHNISTTPEGWEKIRDRWEMAKYILEE